MNKVLIVEDERSIRQALRFELEDEGYEVFDAADYPEALSAFYAFQCDLVISDLYFSQGDGMQLLEEIHKYDRTVPFIAITAFPDTRLADTAKNRLKDNFFVKPFPITVLRDKVSELLKREDTTARAV